MLILGINDDHFESGVSLVDGEQIVFAANEERYTRLKNQGGFPVQSLQGLLDYTGINPEDISHICVSGIMTPPLPKRILPRLQRWLEVSHNQNADNKINRWVDFLIHQTGIAHTTPGSLVPRLVKPCLTPAVKRILPYSLQQAKLHFVEHHHAHACAAYYLSGCTNALAITADGMGDGLSLTVSQCANQQVQRLDLITSRHSIGLFFEMMTEAFGFIPCRHEGKLTGLAAMGNADNVAVDPLFSWSENQLHYHGLRGRQAVIWARESLLAHYAREDVAAWAQRQLETSILAIATHWLQKTNNDHLVLAGGIFANVTLNQKLHELPMVKHLFVCPNMGDGGLSVGAISANGFLPSQAIKDVFLGEDFTFERMAKAIHAKGLMVTQPKSIAAKIATALQQDKLVARFTGRMEWGPRALGNRSILAKTTNSDIVQRLNHLLKRNDFMPFAPAALAEDLDEYITGLAGAAHTAEFMTVCFTCTEQMKIQHPAIVHTDNTARMQAVRAETNPEFHAILTAYKALSGQGILLNTSFNVHEEPIVHTPEQAVNTFLQAGLDYLAIGSFWVEAP